MPSPTISASPLIPPWPQATVQTLQPALRGLQSPSSWAALRFTSCFPHLLPLPCNLLIGLLNTRPSLGNPPCIESSPAPPSPTQPPILTFDSGFTSSGRLSLSPLVPPDIHRRPVSPFHLLITVCCSSRSSNLSPQCDRRQGLVSSAAPAPGHVQRRRLSECPVKEDKRNSSS